MGILGCLNGASYIYAALRRMRDRWVELPSSTTSWVAPWTEMPRPVIVQRDAYDFGHSMYTSRDRLSGQGYTSCPPGEVGRNLLLPERVLSNINSTYICKRQMSIDLTLSCMDSTKNKQPLNAPFNALVRTFLTKSYPALRRGLYAREKHTIVAN